MGGQVGHGPCAAGAGRAAYRGAQGRGVLLCADPRCSNAACVEPSGGNVPAHRFARHRAGYRSAQDLVFTPSLSQAPGSLCADGGTVGGSAGFRAFCLSAPAADPIPQDGRGVSGGFSRFSPTQDYCLVAEKNVDIPVPHGRHGRGGG